MSKGCCSCHNGVNIGGTSYFPFGVREVPTDEVRPPKDVGRFQVTNTAADRYVFKSPSLRNIALTPPYFHSGKVWTLADAVTIMGTAQLGIELSPAETEKITSFLRTLTGDQPRVVYPVLPPNSKTTPRPML
jgi:cytochrome c peroxidase